jgi:hypothetical protein
MDVNRTEQIAAIAAKIRALLAKTTEQGCTESEALLAASKAQQLMEKYQLSLTETELRAEQILRDRRPSKGRIDDTVRNGLAMAIAAFTDCRCYVNGYRVKETVYTGLESDVQFARFLHDSLADFIDRGAKRAMKDGLDRRSFSLGASHRIAERLREEVKARKAEAAKNRGSGVDLMVMTKANMLDRFFKDIGLKLRSRTQSVARGDGGSYSAGHSYGNGATFSRPVNGGGSVARIGAK